MYQSNYLTKKRLFATFVAATFIFVVIFFKIFYIQIIWGKKLQAKALDQWTRDLPLTALRGNITDRNGVVLATSETSFTLYLRAKNVEDAEKVAGVLSEVLGLDYDQTLKKAKNKSISEITVKRQISSEKADKIRAYNLKGVYFAEDSSRVYSYGDFLSQVLGFVSIDNEGQSGIEAAYDKYLKGIDGQILTQTDLIGKELSDKSIIYLSGVKGLDVQLTIDFQIQIVLENLLEQIMIAHGA